MSKKKELISIEFKFLNISNILNEIHIQLKKNGMQVGP